MKKIYAFLCAASALFAATSCQQEIDAPIPEEIVKEVMTITATVGAETKTVLGDNGVSSFWTNEDQISVFDSKKEGNNRKFSVVTESVEFPAATATFALDAKEEFVWPQDGQTDPLIVALYPYQEAAYCDFFYYDRNYISGLNIPVEQKAVKDAFDPTATFALATGKFSTKDELNFTNLYSLLRVTLKEEGVTKVRVTMTGNNIAIAGEAKVQLDLKVDGEVPYFNGGVLTASGSDSVTLECEGGFEVGEKYYIAVAPVIYTNIKVELLKGETWTEVKNTTPAQPKALEANHIYNISNLDDPKTVADGVYLNEDGAYEISNEAGLFWLADQVNKGTEYFAGKTVKLVDDIDLADAEWTPIGSAYLDHGFMGNFDGDNKTIKNLNISNISLDKDGYAYAGLFGVTEGTDKDNQNCIKNLTIENVTISTTGHIVAAAIAYPYYTVVENITVKGEISIKGGDYTAGVLAYTRRCIDVSDISIEGNDGSSIEGRMTVGGVISDIQMNGGLKANYSNFKASGLNITADMHVGGISGIISKQTLDGATVKNVTIVCEDVRKGTVSGSLGDPSTIKNISVENVTGATNVVGATFKDGAAVVGDENGVYTAKVWAERNLAFAVESGTATYGENFELPKLTGEGDLAKAVYTVTEGDAATVTEAGDVTLVKGGTVIITATVPADDTHLEGEATYTLTVNKADRNLAFSPTSVTVTYGQEFTLPTLSGVTTDVKYRSSNTAVATVDETTGAITYGNTVGETTITAYAEANETHLAGEASYILTVEKATRTLSFSGSTASATYGDKNITVPTLSGGVDGVVFSSSKENVATVANDGTVTLVGGGETIITATLIETATHTGASASYTLTVNKATRTLSFDKTSLSVSFGDGFSDFTKPTLSGDLNGVKYESSDLSVAKVDNKGDVTFLSSGEVTITAKLEATQTHLAAVASYQVKATQKVRIYVQVWPHNNKWDNWKGTPKIHYWGDYGETSWPGNEMICESGSKFYYEFEYSTTKKTQFLINNGNGKEKSGDSASITMNQNYSYQVYTEWNNNYSYLTLHKD